MRFSLPAVALALFLFFLALTPWTTLWDRDEPRFAQATVEMLDSGQYLYPTFNGQLRPDKPILIYWLMALPVRLLGPREIAARFFSPVGIALTALLTAFIARRLLPDLGNRAGLWTVGILATVPLVLIEGLAATTDAVLLATITGALAAFAAALERGPRILHLLAMTACLALAQLAKGPVGLTVPVLAMLGAITWLRFQSGKSRTLTALTATVGFAALASLGIFLLWAVPANEATFGEFARRGIGHHVVERSVSPLEGHGGGFLVSLPYYLPVILIGFAPWTLYLPAAVSAVLGGRIGGRRAQALLVGWIAPVFLMFTLVATKLPHYVLPLWPALALAVAGTLEAARQGRLAPRDERWLRRGVWFFAPVALLEAAGFLAVAFTPPAAGMRWPSLITAAVLLATAAAALRHHVQGRLLEGAAFLLRGTLVLQIAIAGLLLPALDRVKPVPPLAAAIRERTPADAPLATYEFDEPSLVFYTGRAPVAPLPSERAVVAWAHAGGQGVLVLPRAALERLIRAWGPLPLSEIAEARGINVSKGNRLQLVALGRNLPAKRPETVEMR